MDTKTWIRPDVFSYLESSREDRTRLQKRYGYYHADNIRFFQNAVEPGSRVLVIGCGVDAIAESLSTSDVLTLELGPANPDAVSVERRVRLKSLDEARTHGPIDYVILPYTLQYLDDIQTFLAALHDLLHAGTRVILLNYNFIWAPILQTAQKIHLKASTPALNWLSPNDTRVMFRLSGFEVVQSRQRTLLPFYIPGLSAFVNQFITPLPVFNLFAQKHFFIARPLMKRATKSPSCSIVVPARNEMGNIVSLFDRAPVMGSFTEIIFVEGHSKDATWDEIGRQIATHPRRNEFRWKAFQQTGNGKADAVQLGFSKATGDILMILDADLTVQPEDLPHFYDALASGVGEFMNGSRLVYQMEKAAMQLLNLFFNKLFGVWMSWIIGQSVKDTLCGTKAFFRKDYERMSRNLDEIWLWDPFGDFLLLLSASRMHLKILDVPVRYRERTYGSTNILRFRHGWQLFKTCMVGWARML